MVRILLALGVAFFVGNLLKTKESNYYGIGGISKDSISDEHLIRYRVIDNEVVIKRNVTSKLNLIIDEYNYFKIGKSGIVGRRGNAYQDFDKMYLLCSSSQSDYIENLETYYNNKYFDHSKNKNIYKGSAGRMSAADGLYYLYVVVKG